MYGLEEIVAEKLRAVLQHAEKLRQRGWNRSRARDYYDLWRVFAAYRSQMDLAGFETFLRGKCEVRGVGFSSAEDFFPQPMLASLSKSWDRWLGPLVPGHPAFETVIAELRQQILSVI